MKAKRKGLGKSGKGVVVFKAKPAKRSGAPLKPFWMLAEEKRAAEHLKAIVSGD